MQVVQSERATYICVDRSAGVLLSQDPALLQRQYRYSMQVRKQPRWACHAEQQRSDDNAPTYAPAGTRRALGFA